jgi:hypothetical protein
MSVDVRSGANRSGRDAYRLSKLHDWLPSSNGDGSDFVARGDSLEDVKRLSGGENIGGVARGQLRQRRSNIIVRIAQHGSRSIDHLWESAFMNYLGHVFLLRPSRAR